MYNSTIIVLQPVILAKTEATCADACRPCMPAMHACMEWDKSALLVQHNPTAYGSMLLLTAASVTGHIYWMSQTSVDVEASCPLQKSADLPCLAFALAILILPRSHLYLKPGMRLLSAPHVCLHRIFHMRPNLECPKFDCAHIRSCAYESVAHVSRKP